MATDANNTPSSAPTTFKLPISSGAPTKPRRGTTSKSARRAPAPAESSELAAEREALRHLIEAAEPDQADPLYPRYVAYLERAEQFEREQIEAAARHHAEPDVPTTEAKKLQSFGPLQAEERDVMELHTIVALRMFLGVAAGTGGNQYGVPGGRRAANNLRNIFALTASNNPGAEFVLVQCDQRLQALHALFRSVEEPLLKAMHQMRSQGLKFSILAAQTPPSVELGYHSPYGYSISHLLVAFDHAVRVIKSAERRDMCSKEEARRTLLKLSSRIRSFFEFTNSATRSLMAEDMRKLSRSDWLPTADEMARIRVSKIKQALGDIPQEILSTDIQPRHHLRNTKLSEREKRLIAELSAKAIVDAESDVAIPPESIGGMVD
jgi:integrating conjugative element protein (TIGR03761 family)